MILPKMDETIRALRPWRSDQDPAKRAKTTEGMACSTEL